MLDLDSILRKPFYVDIPHSALVKSTIPKEVLMFETNKFVRKPFYVEAVRVTAANMFEIAKWCEGEVQSTEWPKVQSTDGPKVGPNTYIKVEVHSPKTERQTKAFVGDWVLVSTSGFKVFTNRAFEKSFEQVSTETIFHATSEE